MKEAFRLTEFRVTEDHLKLMRRMYVGWQDSESGAPEIDPKRPYGNSYVALDVAIILGWVPPDTDDLPTHGLYERAKRIHREMEIALHITLRTGQFKAGLYRRSDYPTANWELVPEVTP